MKRFVLRWTLAGFIIPVGIMVITWIQGGIFKWPALAVVLWPTSIMLMGTMGQEFTAMGIVVLVISVLLNQGLYSLVGSVLWLVYRRLSSEQ